MLENKKVTIVSESTIDGKRVAVFAAALDLDKLEITTTARYMNGMSYGVNRDYVCSDMEQFTHLVHSIQDMMQDVTTGITDTEEEVIDE